MSEKEEELSLRERFQSNQYRSQTGMIQYNEMFVFGSNRYGQIGLSEKNAGKNFCIPRFCHFNTVFTSVSCGAHHSVLLTQDGYVYTVGSNIYGQLGSKDCQLNYSFTPSLVQQLENHQVIKVVAGAYHNLALTSDRKLFSWGRNHDGQLGLSQSISHLPDPSIVEKSEEVKITDIFGGWNHSFFITQEKQIFGFGCGIYGELGQGKSESSNKPVQVSINETQHRVVKISSGENHTLFLTAEGNLLTCGENQQGPAGIGGNKKVLIAPIIIHKELFGSEKISDIACGKFSVAVTSQTSSIYAWGHICGSQTPVGIPKLIMSLNTNTGQLTSVRKIAVSGESCLIQARNGNVYSWGKNSFGECGLGDFEDKSSGFHPLNFLKDKKILTFHMGEGHSIVLGRELYWRDPEKPISFSNANSHCSSVVSQEAGLLDCSSSFIGSDMKEEIDKKDSQSETGFDESFGASNPTQSYQSNSLHSQSIKQNQNFIVQKCPEPYQEHYSQKVERCQQRNGQSSQRRSHNARESCSMNRQSQSQQIHSVSLHSEDTHRVTYDSEGSVKSQRKLEVVCREINRTLTPLRNKESPTHENSGFMQNPNNFSKPSSFSNSNSQQAQSLHNNNNNIVPGHFPTEGQSSTFSSHRSYGGPYESAKEQSSNILESSASQNCEEEEEETRFTAQQFSGVPGFNNQEAARRMESFVLSKNSFREAYQHEIPAAKQMSANSKKAEQKQNHLDFQDKSYSSNDTHDFGSLHSNAAGISINSSQSTQMTQNKSVTTANRDSVHEQQKQQQYDFLKLNDKLNVMNEAFQGLIRRLALENNQATEMILSKTISQEQQISQKLNNTPGQFLTPNRQDFNEQSYPEYFTLDNNQIQQSGYSQTQFNESHLIQYPDNPETFNQHKTNQNTDNPNQYSCSHSKNKHRSFISDNYQPTNENGFQQSDQEDDEGQSQEEMQNSNFDPIKLQNFPSEKKETIDFELQRQHLELQNILQHQNISILASIQKFKQEYAESQNNPAMQQKISKLTSILSTTAALEAENSKENKNLNQNKGLTSSSSLSLTQQRATPLQQKSINVSNNNMPTSASPNKASIITQPIKVQQQMSNISLELSIKEKELSDLQLSLANKELKMQTLELKNSIQNIQYEQATKTLAQAMSIIDNFHLFSKNFAKFAENSPHQIQ